MATNPNRWYFSKEKLLNSPTVRCGVDPEKELSYRQQAANLIQDMGQKLQVYQLCINTAIVYMHRFYMYHSFTKFPRNAIAAAALFLAAKVEEQPHKLEHVIRVAHACLHRGEPPLDPRSNAYAQQAQELVINESIILQTLGFEVGVVHPHTHVVKCTQMIRASKDLSQSSYFLATNSLHLTTFSLQYKPTVVACVCIHLACKWTQWTIPRSSDGKGWWEYIDSAVTEDQLNELTREFLNIIDRCPMRLKKRIMGYRGNQAKDGKKTKTDGQSSSDSVQQHQKASTSQADSGASTSIANDAFDYSFDTKPASGYDQFSDSEDSKADEPAEVEKLPKEKNPPVVLASAASTHEQPRKSETVKVSYEEYKRKEQERKEKERKEKELQVKRQEASLSHVEMAQGKSHVKESRPHGHEKHPPGLDKNADALKVRVSKGPEKSSGQERVHPSHEKPHTGHDRMHPHEKHGLSHRKDHPSSHRHGHGQEKVHSGHMRGPSGPERLPSSQDRSSSGSHKAPASLGREPPSHSRHGQEKIPADHGMKTQDKSLVTGSSSLDIAKYPATEKLREEKRPEIHPPLPTLGSNENIPKPRPSETHRKDTRDRSHSHSEKGAARSDKSKKERHAKPQHHQNKERSAHVHRTKDEIPQLKTEQLFNPEELATSATLDMLTQIRDEVLNQLNEDISQEKERSSALRETSPLTESTSTEHRQAKADKAPPPVESVQAGSPSTNVAKPPHKSFLKVMKEELAEIQLQEQIPVEVPVPEESRESQERREKREHSERKREDKERRREHHKEKKHRSHKHRHHSPHLQKQSHENDLGEASSDMVPAKKQKLEQSGSPHTVLTTSQGIKLKIKGLSNSFNGSDQNNGREANVNSDSPGRIKLNLKLNSSHDGSPAEGSKERDGSNHHHHRSHHKHKSRHHRSKDGHRKRPRSPGLSSASDASPALSSPKKRTPDTIDGTKTTLPSSQSLLNLPMPPSIVKSSSQRRSPSVKHSKWKQGTIPPLPHDTPPPPPPPPPPYQYSTIDFSALYDEFQPPLPNDSPNRPPPPPPIPPPQKRPPLPP